jgi:hypothetical protein
VGKDKLPMIAVEQEHEQAVLQIAVLTVMP